MRAIRAWQWFRGQSARELFGGLNAAERKHSDQSSVRVPDDLGVPDGGGSGGGLTFVLDCTGHEPGCLGRLVWKSQH
jgi:hypothetical protein